MPVSLSPTAIIKIATSVGLSKGCPPLRRWRWAADRKAKTVAPISRTGCSARADQATGSSSDILGPPFRLRLALFGATAELLRRPSGHDDGDHGPTDDGRYEGHDLSVQPVEVDDHPHASGDKQHPKVLEDAICERT